MNLQALLERLSPRERLLVGGAAAVTVLLLAWWLANTMADHRHALQAQIGAAERDLAEIITMRDRYLRMRADNEASQRTLAQGGAGFSLFSHLESLGREVVGRERIASMNPSTRNISEDLQEEDVEMRLSGVSLRHLTTLLYRVEKSDLPLLVSRLQLKKRYDAPSLFDATVLIGRLRPLAGSSGTQ